jgi:octaprenyl-diphosphate synthase
MSKLDTIKEPVAKELKEFEPFFRGAMKSKVPLLSVITNYILRTKGKQLRPLLVYLSAGLNGEIGNSTKIAAAMIELLHTATLVHDDVVDEAYERRGFLSINALWRSKAAVLVGDFLLSKGLLLAIESNEVELLRNMSEAVKKMSEGELLQIERSRKMDIDEDIYYQIIGMKTAILLSSCTINGASSVGASPENIERMREFGFNLGMAFQIRDDLFDYKSKGITGKPTGNDIREKKLTLPLIYALSKVGSSAQREIRALVRKSKKDSKAVEKVVEFANRNGGIEYTEQKMSFYHKKAVEALMGYPKSSYRDALESLADYIVERNS